jgi:hypothetical protein
MNWDEAFAVSFVVGVVVGPALAMFFYVPRLARSLTRYSLWTLRDRIVDDMFDGRLDSDDPGVRRLLTITEGAITATRGITLLGIVVAELTVFRNTPIPPLPSDLTTLNSGQRRLLMERETTLRNITARHTLFGSPSGWVALLVSPFALIALGVWLILSGRVKITRMDTLSDVSDEVRRPFERRVFAAPSVLPSEGLPVDVCI